MELWAYDTRLRLFMPKTLDPRVIILDIDEKSLNAEGAGPGAATRSRGWSSSCSTSTLCAWWASTLPSPRPTPARARQPRPDVPRRLKDDAPFQEVLKARRGSLDYDRIFAEEIAKRPVILGFFLGGKTDKAGVLPPPIFSGDAFKPWEVKHNLATGYSGNLETLSKAATAAGHLYPQLDFDGVTRRVPIYMKYGDGFYEALSFAMTRTTWATSRRNSSSSPPTWDPGQRGIRGYRGPARAAGRAHERPGAIPRGTGAYRYVSATDVVRGTLPAEELKDKTSSSAPRPRACSTCARPPCARISRVESTRT